jgi:hypothetical protein
LVCQERKRLAGAYDQAIRDLSRTLAVLNARIAEGPGDDRLRRVGEEARGRLELARRALELHRVEHGC